jgi:hypothetical protein
MKDHHNFDANVQHSEVVAFEIICGLTSLYVENHELITKHLNANVEGIPEI